MFCLNCIISIVVSSCPFFFFFFPPSEKFYKWEEGIGQLLSIPANWGQFCITSAKKNSRKPTMNSLNSDLRSSLLITIRVSCKLKFFIVSAGFIQFKQVLLSTSAFASGINSTVQCFFHCSSLHYIFSNYCGEIKKQIRKALTSKSTVSSKENWSDDLDRFFAGLGPKS